MVLHLNTYTKGTFRKCVMHGKVTAKKHVMLCKRVDSELHNSKYGLGPLSLHPSNCLCVLNYVHLCMSCVCCINIDVGKESTTKQVVG